MSTATRDLSALQMSVRYGIAENTARLFMHKVLEAMKSDEKDGMKSLVQIDDFTIEGKEDGTQGRSYDLYIII